MYSKIEKRERERENRIERERIKVPSVQSVVEEKWDVELQRLGKLEGMKEAEMEEAVFF